MQENTEKIQCRLASWEPPSTSLLGNRWPCLTELVNSSFVGLALTCMHFPDLLWNLSPTCQPQSLEDFSKISCRSNFFWVKGQRMVP